MKMKAFRVKTMGVFRRKNLLAIAALLMSGCGGVGNGESVGTKFLPGTVDTNQPVIDNPAQLTAPLAPSSVVADDVGNDRIVLEIEDASGNEEGFEIVRTRQGGGQKTFTMASNPGKGNVSFEDPDDLFFGTYTYKVRSVNAFGNSEYKQSNSVSMGSINK